MFAVLILVTLLVPQQVTREPVAGVNNFARLETTVACAGSIKPEAIAELKARGYKSIFDLQRRDEPTANVDAEAAAAKAAGIAFVHVPFTPAAPDTASIDLFLKEIRNPANEPAFIHCSGGNRASGFWLIKRVLVDGWDVERATKEAEALGLQSSPDAPMKKFVLEYLEKRK
jgi:uncharacterized protein (TIGR01244 family)